MVSYNTQTRVAERAQPFQNRTYWANPEINCVVGYLNSFISLSQKTLRSHNAQEKQCLIRQGNKKVDGIMDFKSIFNFPVDYDMNRNSL